MKNLQACMAAPGKFVTSRKLRETVTMYHEVDDYEIISEHNVNDLKMKVKELLAQGWKLCGDLQIVAAVQSDMVAPLFTQVMVQAKR
ncbi:MAG: DUF1737 domain-containing protein [Geobacter sp.]|nr:MAG: DUF1737 domain-containing protein [Geobacter sp.]